MIQTKSVLARLTPKQQRIMDYIRDYCRRERTSPTLKEIGGHFGCRSLNAVRQHLRLIEKKGQLTLKAGQARGIRLVEDSTDPFSSNNTPSLDDMGRVPLVGQIAAGSPILAEENFEGYLLLPECFQPAHRFFALRVEGDSMVGIGILSGDIAIFEKCEDVGDGAVAAVRVGDHATLKRIHRTKDHLVLQAENPAVADLVILSENAAEVKVEGRLAGVLRCCLPGRQVF
jgi:repressor LexA